MLLARITAVVALSALSSLAASVTLKLTATDRDGHPVRDLQTSDLHVSDDKSDGQIIGLRAVPNSPAQPLVILFDLINFGTTERGVMATRLKEAVAAVPATTPLYVYAIGTDGHVYAVIPVAGKFARFAVHPARTELLGQMLDKTFEQLFQPRHVDLTSHTEELTKVRFDAFGNVANQLEPLHGHKQILWISYGIPSAVNLAVNGYTDLAPRLRFAAAKLNHDDITVYSADPSQLPSNLNRAGLELLANATGGRTFDSDITAAINQAVLDAQSGYQLEYVSSAGPSKLGYSNVHVTCNRKDVRLIAQQVYLQSK